MLSVQYIREHAELVREALRRRHSEAPVDQVLALDEQRRSLLGEVESLRAEQNSAGKQIGAARGEERAALIAAQRGGSERLKQLEPVLSETERQL
jgi:seryl-tRNA synthetase